MALHGSQRAAMVAWAGVLLLAAAETAAAASCVGLDCEAAGDEESVLLQRQEVMAHDFGGAPPHQMDKMEQPPKFVLALAAKAVASKKAVGVPSSRSIQDLSLAPEDSEKKLAGILEPPAVQYVAALTPYIGYEGELRVEGTMTVEGTGLIETATQTLSWELAGTDPKCKKTPEGVPNACGIHIHQGTSCYAGAGGHYWNKTLFDQDPWATVTYKTRRYFKYEYAVEVGVPVVTGLTNFEVLGHTMIVHDSTGARVACGIIVPQKLGVPALTPYFNYDGPLKVTGGLAVTSMGVADDAGQTLSWSLQGVDPRCSNGANAEFSNSCGVHIHAGTSCTDDALGHYWNKTTYSDDPWSVIGYSSEVWFWTYTQAWEKWAPVATGLESTLVNGHTMVVHDYEGGRVACGIISPWVEVANAFVPYYSYQGDLEVSGWVKVVGAGVLEEASQVLTWELTGVDPACNTAPGPDANANACGIHVHVGMDCTSNAGGHYHSVDPDPWTAVKYKTLPGGHTNAAMQSVDTGLTNYDVLGHTMIVHDSTGARIACGILNIASE